MTTATATPAIRLPAELKAERVTAIRKQPTPYDRHGAKNPRWKGGHRRRHDGYVLVYSPDHPTANKNMVLEHRLVMERHLGRYLRSDEYVHHKNGLKHDNRIENLEVTNEADHARLHFTGRRYYRWKSRATANCIIGLYWGEGLTIRQCGDRLGISYGGMQEHFARFGILKRSQGSR